MAPVTDTGIDAMVGKYDRRNTWWYRVFRQPLPLVSNPRESMLPETGTGRRLLVGDRVEFVGPYQGFTGGRVKDVFPGVNGPMAGVEVEPGRTVDTLCRRLRRS